jgi:hypothetical protein
MSEGYAPLAGKVTTQIGDPKSIHMRMRWRRHPAFFLFMCLVGGGLFTLRQDGDLAMWMFASIGFVVGLGLLLLILRYEKNQQVARAAGRPDCLWSSAADHGRTPDAPTPVEWPTGWFAQRGVERVGRTNGLVWITTSGIGFRELVGSNRNWWAHWSEVERVHITRRDNDDDEVDVWWCDGRAGRLFLKLDSLGEDALRVLGADI